MTKKRLLLNTGICLLAMAATVAAVTASRTVPDSQCRDVYLQFRDDLRVKAAFFKDKRINDSISVDMTMLTVDDSAGMVYLLYSLGESDSIVNYVMNSPYRTVQGKNVFDSDPNHCILSLYRRDNPTPPEGSIGDVMAIFYTRKTVVLISADNERLYDWLIGKLLLKEIDVF